MNVENKFLKVKRIVEKNFEVEKYNDVKFVMIHMDMLELFREINSLISDFMAIPLDHNWNGEMAMMETFKRDLKNLEVQYDELSTSCMEEIEVTATQVVDLKKYAENTLELYRSALIYCYNHILQKEKEMIY